LGPVNVKPIIGRWPPAGARRQLQLTEDGSIVLAASRASKSSGSKTRWLVLSAHAVLSSMGVATEAADRAPPGARGG
jgi:hypothetical protein